MLKYLLSFGFVFLIGCNTASNSQSTKKNEAPKVIVITEKNSVILRGAIEPEMSVKIQNELIEKDKSLPKSETLYLILDTPGGRLDAGMEIVQIARSLDREIKTITVQSYSMGFFIVQLLGERLITPNGSFMAHEVFLAVQGKLRTEFLKTLRRDIQEIESIELRCATRMEITLQDYFKMTEIDYYIRGGENAVKQKAADRVVVAECDKELTEEKIQMAVKGRDGLPYLVTYSKCPFKREILAVKSLLEH